MSAAAGAGGNRGGGAAAAAHARLRRGAAIGEPVLTPAQRAIRIREDNERARQLEEAAQRAKGRAASDAKKRVSDAQLQLRGSGAARQKKGLVTESLRTRRVQGSLQGLPGYSPIVLSSGSDSVAMSPVVKREFEAGPAASPPGPRAAAADARSRVGGDERDFAGLAQQAKRARIAGEGAAAGRSMQDAADEEGLTVDAGGRIVFDPSAARRGRTMAEIYDSIPYGVPELDRRRLERIREREAAEASPVEIGAGGILSVEDEPQPMVLEGNTPPESSPVASSSSPVPAFQAPEMGARKRGKRKPRRHAPGSPISPFELEIATFEEMTHIYIAEWDFEGDEAAYRAMEVQSLQEARDVADAADRTGVLTPMSSPAASAAASPQPQQPAAAEFASPVVLSVPSSPPSPPQAPVSGAAVAGVAVVAAPTPAQAAALVAQTAAAQAPDAGAERDYGPAPLLPLIDRDAIQDALLQRGIISERVPPFEPP